MSFTAFRDATKKKGGTPEDARRKDENMHNVMEALSPSNTETFSAYRLQSDNKKAADAIDKLVAEAATKGKAVTRIVTLTPVLASVLLERNPANRKLSASLVDTYAYEIAGGRWVFNGEPIIISDTGELNDGQHRCEAVVQSGRSIEVVLVVGVSRTSRTTLDQGRARTAGDYLSMQGHINTTALAGAANLAWQYRNRGQLAAGSSARATKTEVQEFVRDNPGLQRSVGLFNNKLARPLGGVSFLAFCHFAIGTAGRREDVDAFFFTLIEGANLGHRHPLLHLRNRLMMMGGNRDTNAKAELVFRAWNMTRKGTMDATRLRATGGLLPVLEA